MIGDSVNRLGNHTDLRDAVFERRQFDVDLLDGCRQASAGGRDEFDVFLAYAGFVLCSVYMMFHHSHLILNSIEMFRQFRHQLDDLRQLVRLRSRSFRHVLNCGRDLAGSRA
ncbi:hypothetical protein D3C81_937490 [compost metagenome]